jgi:DNA-binding transcriptional regulator YhcF (GntR family)
MPSAASRSPKRPQQIDADSPLPIFLQVAQRLNDRLQEGRFQAGERFTTVREVATDFGISFVTAQRAMSCLAEQQLIRSERGRGTVVLVSSRKRKSRSREPKIDIATRRVTVLWPTHMPVATALRSNLLATVDGLRAALPNYSVSLEFAGDLLLEDRAHVYLDSLLSGGSFSAFCLLSAPHFVKRYFEDREIPTIVLGDVEPGIKLSCVSSDEEQAQYDLTTHLIRMGHRRIAQIISAPRVAGHEPRLRGYRRALTEAAKNADGCRDEWEMTLPQHDRDEAIARFKSLLSGSHPPTAAICTALPLATWMQEAAGEGFHVAYDVDREPLHFPLRPSSVLVWPGERMGRLAGELLSQQVAGDFSHRHEILSYSQIKDRT